jgi:hypothetical protein
VGRVEIARFDVVSLQDAIYSIGREPSLYKHVSFFIVEDAQWKKEGKRKQPEY